MSSAYPTSLDTLATNKANSTVTDTDHPGHHNDMADAINKIELELGTDPGGTFTDVKSRLNARLTCRKTADTTNATTTLANVTDLTLPIGTTGLDYYFMFLVPWSSNTAGVSARFAITFPAVTGYGVYWVENAGGGTVLPATGGTAVTFDTVKTASGTATADVGGTSIPGANVVNIARISGIISNPSATGSIVVQGSAETTGTITFKRGAWGEIYIN